MKRPFTPQTICVPLLPSLKARRYVPLAASLLFSFNMLISSPAQSAVPVTKKHPAGSAELKPSTASTASNSVVMKAMDKELKRSFEKLKNAGPAPVHFLAYRVYDEKTLTITANYGGLENDPEINHNRVLNVELRAGTPKLDSYHHTRNAWKNQWKNMSSSFPIEDDEDALRVALWEQTDESFKDAQKSLNAAQSNKDVLVAEEDISNDFSQEQPQIYTGKKADIDVDIEAWKKTLRRSSLLFKQYPHISDSHITMHANLVRRFMVNSEGARIEDTTVQYSLSLIARAVADDGMQVWLYDHAESPNIKDLPSEQKLDEMVRTLAKNVEQLRVAAVAEPFAGPVILQSKAAGVFFHEVFGHRAEGLRQKNDVDGRTFSKMIGKKIMPSFITVRDDPTRQKLGSLYLNGFYRFDDEGVPASNVLLVDHGILKSFLMGRSPLKGFDHSNGHGRSSPGANPAARQGNLMVESSKQVPYAQLKEMLIAEIKRQGKPYGLIFDEIAGGFTITETHMPQSFKLLPLRVYRVYADGKPDELLRGVSIIGTPLASLETIMCSGNDYNTFNGNCGAESGWVPVSASAPSLLLKTLEIERQAKSLDRPPILPPPTKESK